METMGERLRKIRLSCGLSQEKVAKLIGVSRPAYVNYESDRSRPVRKLNELANAFGVTTDYILGNVQPPEPIKHDVITNEEKRFLEKYRVLDKDSKSLVNHVLDYAIRLNVK